MDRPAHPTLLEAFLVGLCGRDLRGRHADDLVPELLLIADYGLALLEQVRDLDASTTHAEWLEELERGLRAYEERMRALAFSCRDVLATR